MDPPTRSGCFRRIRVLMRTLYHPFKAFGRYHINHDHFLSHRPATAGANDHDGRLRRIGRSTGYQCGTRCHDRDHTDVGPRSGTGTERRRGCFRPQSSAWRARSPVRDRGGCITFRSSHTGRFLGCATTYQPGVQHPLGTGHLRRRTDHHRSGYEPPSWRTGSRLCSACWKPASEVGTIVPLLQGRSLRAWWRTKGDASCLSPGERRPFVPPPGIPPCPDAV